MLPRRELLLKRELSTAKAGRSSKPKLVTVSYFPCNPNQLEPENVKRIHQGYTEDNAIEFDNQWNNVTEQLGYQTTFKHPDPHMLASQAHNSQN